MASPNWIQCDFIQIDPVWVDSTCGAGGGPGGFSTYTYDGPVRRTDEDVRRSREAFRVIPKVIAEVAAGQARRLEQDAQKRFEELERELQARNIQWRAEYFEALNAERERLITAEISARLHAMQAQQRYDEAVVLTLLAAVV